MEAFQARVGLLLAEQDLLREADLVLDRALAVHHANPYDPNPEGGPG